MAGRERGQAQGVGSKLCVLVRCTLCQYVLFGAADEELRGDQHNKI